MAPPWTDPAQDWLEHIGSEYRARIDADEPQFLVEIQVPGAHLIEIFRQISKAHLPISNSSAWACLALAAVHLAAEADDDERGFRALFYSRLGRPLDTREWEQHFGRPIAEFLRDHFAV